MNDAELLAVLEAELPDTPAAGRRSLQAQIDALRARLGRPAEVSLSTPKRDTKASAPDHAAARALYAEYLTKKVELLRARDYADRVARATAGSGMTPVYPLACMGPGGGPLRCDVCGRPMILEGGSYNGVYADAAWARNERADPLWRSWISGGMVVRIAANGTLRVYHGYPGHADHCCDVGMRAELEPAPPGPAERAAFTKLLAFLEHTSPSATDRERQREANEVLNTLADWAAGFGVNTPGET